MATTVRSFCKINLGLAVGPARPDGFHALTTVYQTIGLHDFVTVSARPAPITHITLQTDHLSVPSTARGDADRNTAYRIVAAALDRLGITAEVTIDLQKRLPVQGGLGAGSANAAAALIALERELGTSLPGPDRLALAAQIGSDVPLFLLGGTVLGLHRGESVFPLPDSPALPVVIAVPSVGISTALAFRDLDERTPAAPGSGPLDLTSQPAADRLEKLSRVLASVWTHTGVGRVATGIASFSSESPAGTEVPPPGSASASSQKQHGDRAGNTGSPGNLLAGVMNPLLALVRTGVENDFEDVAFRQHPSLCDIKRALAGSSDAPGSQALYAALSGSGSALFGIYSSPEAAHEAQQRVQSLGVRALPTETLSHREYWRQMFA